MTTKNTAATTTPTPIPQGSPQSTPQDIVALESDISLLWKFSTRGLIMMILLAFAFSHIMTMMIEFSLLKMSSEGFDRHFSRLNKAVSTYFKQRESSEKDLSLEEKLEYWFRQTDLAGLRFESKDLSLTLCRPDILEKELEKYETSLPKDKRSNQMDQFSLQVEGHFNLPMLSKLYEMKLPIPGAEKTSVKLYIHFTWIEWKLIEFRVISVIMSLILMIFLLLAAGVPVKDASQKLLEYSNKLQSANSSLADTNVELEKKTRHLIQTSKLATLGELSATVSHEIKNPLAAISSGLQLLETHLENGNTDKSGEILRRVSSEIERLHQILISMLKFARPSKEESGYFSTAPLVKKVLLLVHKYAQNNKVTIETDVEDSEQKVMGDPIQIEQVLLNLILNSIQAIADEGRVTIRIRHKDEAVHIQVIDNGSGLGETEPEELFEAFSSESEDGTGLGLSISRNIVERHGGTLTLQNNKDTQGATATVTLPLNEG